MYGGKVGGGAAAGGGALAATGASNIAVMAGISIGMVVAGICVIRATTVLRNQDR